MADLTYRLQIAFSKGNVEMARVVTTQDVTVAGDYALHDVQAVGFAAAEALRLGEITTPGFCLFHNTDATNFVEIGYDDTGFKPTVKVLAGEWALFRLTQAAPQAKADTASVDLEYYMIEA